MFVCVCVCGEKAAAEAEKQQLQAVVEKLKADANMVCVSVMNRALRPLHL